MSDSQKKDWTRLEEKYEKFFDHTPKKQPIESKTTNLKNPWEKTDEAQERLYDKIVSYLSTQITDSNRVFFIYIGLIFLGAVLVHFVFRFEAGSIFDSAHSRNHFIDEQMNSFHLQETLAEKYYSDMLESRKKGLQSTPDDFKHIAPNFPWY